MASPNGECGAIITAVHCRYADFAVETQRRKYGNASVIPKRSPQITFCVLQKLTLRCSICGPKHFRAEESARRALLKCKLLTSHFGPCSSYLDSVCNVFDKSCSTAVRECCKQYFLPASSTSSEPASRERSGLDTSGVQREPTQYSMVQLSTLSKRLFVVTAILLPCQKSLIIFQTFCQSRLLGLLSVSFKLKG